MKHSGDAQRMITLAEDILKLSRNTLLVNLRFLDTAMSMFTYVCCPNQIIPQSNVDIKGGLAVNERYILYDPRWLLRRYQAEKEAVVRDYLHMVFHCVFRHAFIGGLVDIPLWDLACDIAVEAAIEDLGVQCTQAARGKQQAPYLSKLRKAVSCKVVQWMKEERNKRAQEQNEKA